MKITSYNGLLPLLAEILAWGDRSDAENEKATYDLNAGGFSGELED